MNIFETHNNPLASLKLTGIQLGLGLNAPIEPEWPQLFVW